MPGMYAEVDLTLARRNRVLTIPIAAMDPERPGDGRDAEQPRRGPRRSQIGMESADKVEVKSGLNEGDLVVVAGRSGLQPGEEVKPKVTAMAAAKE